MSSPFVGEIIGTMLLILLGDGVVANVLLGKTKGNSSGWIVITTAWGMAVFVGHAVMDVDVVVPLSQVQIDADQHQPTRREQLQGYGFAQQRYRHRRADEGRRGEIGAGAGGAEMA